MIATCVDCKVELRPYMIGVNVVEYNDKEPCRIWNADEWHCPICNIKIVIRFGCKPTEQWEPVFTSDLKQIMDPKYQGKLREVFERPLKEDDQDDGLCIGQGEPPDQEAV